MFPIEQARFSAAVTDRIAFGDELKDISRHQQSVLQQNPSATDGITTSSPTGQHPVAIPGPLDRTVLGLPEDRPLADSPTTITAADAAFPAPARVHLLPSDPPDLSDTSVSATGTDRNTR